MNQQSIECECGCWNIVLKVVPPGEPCPYCGSSEPHDMCPEKAKALGIELPEPCRPPIEEAKPDDKKFNIFQFERCKECGKMHLVGGVCPYRGAKPLKRYRCGTHAGGAAGPPRSGKKCGDTGKPKIPGACHPHGSGGFDCLAPQVPASSNKARRGHKARESFSSDTSDASAFGSSNRKTCPARQDEYTTTYCYANR